MSKNSKNKKYYEIGILSVGGSLIHRYVTELEILEFNILNERFAGFLKKIHGDNILISYNEKYGRIPKNIDIIDIELPKKPTLQYNK